MIVNKAKMNAEILRSDTIKNGLSLSVCSRYIIKLDDTYATASEILAHNPLVRSTNGSYFVKYNPPGSVHNKDFPFVIGNDLLGFRLQVNGSRHFELIANVFPEVAWMLRNTNYTPELFSIAKMHPGMIVPFTLNFPVYVAKILDQIHRDGLTHLDILPLFTSRRPVEEVNYNAIPYFFAPNRVKYKDKIIEMKKLAQACKDEEK